MAEQNSYDLVIIGGGNGGYVPAIRAAQLGMSVALVEKDKVGGTCLHMGCIPTKALLQSADLLHRIKNGKEFGVGTGEIEFDYAATARRKDQVVDRLHKGVQGLMKKNKIELYNGTASFIEPKKIKVEGQDGEGAELGAKNVLIASGSQPKSLPGLEIDHERVITSDDVVRMTGYPDSVIILGAGAVGVEFASMYNDFGVDVTVVEVLENLVPLEDPEVRGELARAFKKRKINVMTSTKADPQSLKKTDDGITIDVDSGGQSSMLAADVLLVAVGRKTVTENLNLDATAVETNERGEIVVDEFYRTGEDGVYAAGDVIGGYWLAHVASHEGIVAVEHMAGEEPLPIDQNLIPRVTFCRPEVASLGLSEEQAREEGYEVKVGKFPFRAIGRALIEGDPDGFVKIVSDAQTNLILGVHAIGPHVTELISEGVLISHVAFNRVFEGTSQEMSELMHPHPSLSEAFGEAAMASDGHAIHLPPTAKTERQETVG